MARVAIELHLSSIKLTIKRGQSPITTAPDLSDIHEREELIELRSDGETAIDANIETASTAKHQAAVRKPAEVVVGTPSRQAYEKLPEDTDPAFPRGEARPNQVLVYGRLGDAA